MFHLFSSFQFMNINTLIILSYMQIFAVRKKRTIIFYYWKLLSVWIIQNESYTSFVITFDILFLLFDLLKYLTKSKTKIYVCEIQFITT